MLFDEEKSVFEAPLKPGQEDMEFKVELTDTYHAISVNMTVRSPDGDRARAQEYFDKVQALTKEFFFSYPEKFIPVYLEDHGMNKINCIKTIREFLQIGLKEAKDLAEAPKPVCLSDGMPRGQAIQFKNKLEEAGCIALVGGPKLHVMR